MLAFGVLSKAIRQNPAEEKSHVEKKVAVASPLHDTRSTCVQYILNNEEILGMTNGRDGETLLQLQKLNGDN